MGLISPGGENLLDLLELGRVSRVTTGTSGTRTGGLRKGQCPWELQGGLLGFLSRRRRGLRPCVESGPEPEVSSPVLTWILGYFWRLPWGVSAHLVWGQARAFLTNCSSSVKRPIALVKGSVAFPRGFPTRLSHRAVPRGTCHGGGEDPRLERRGSAGKTSSSGMD